ncbi:hypothetical protein X726_32685 [Mesorhizobium sp. L103C105A0]|nr:hypothetical protein X726_32685 [Mesorhizobium sp. L103C105A0]
MRGPTGSAGLVSSGGQQQGTARAAVRADSLREEAKVRTQSRVALPLNLERVNAAAKQAAQTRFTALLHHVDEEALYRAFRRQKRQASAGVDGMTVAKYEEGLTDNIRDFLRTGPHRSLPATAGAAGLHSQSRWR